MRQISDTQKVLLQSFISNALQSQDFPIRFTIIDETKTAVDAIHYEPEQGSFMTLEEEPIPESAVAESLICSLQREGTALLIHANLQTNRISLKGNSVQREAVEDHPAVLQTASWAVGKATHLDPNQAAPLLKTIELMTASGEIKAPLRKKFKQVNHFLEQVSPLLKHTHPHTPFTIIDCGCGKTYLGFVLFWYVRRVLKLKARFYGVDVSEPLIELNRARAKKLSLPEMQFECAPIAQASLPDSPDILVSLHACDTATDEAIAAGVALRAKHIITVPCCQHEIASQLKEVPQYPLSKKHGIFTNRFGDLLTDMMRSLFLEAQGYSVTAGEFISPFETPKNLMLRATRGNHYTKIRREEYEAFKQFYRIYPSIDRFLLEREAVR
jgi:SAM-dependent methyltransferase